MILYACGAYGRNAMLKDWKAGKDFKIIDGPYFSIRDLANLKQSGYIQIDFIGPKGFIDFSVRMD